MSTRAKDILPPILYEDADVLALDKPSGLLTAPDRWDKALENLIDLVRRRLGQQYANVHRLDRQTSGVVLVAKTPEAVRVLTEQFGARQVRKEYLALTASAPAEASGSIVAAIVPSRDRPGRMCVGRGGSDHSCRTDYEILERFRGGCALLRLMPQSGKTHQIRVHLMHVRCPIVGDDLYGSARGIYLSDLKRGYKQTNSPERPLMGRLALHARSLTFTHPRSGSAVTVESPLPHDFEVALKYLRRFAATAP